MALKKETHIVSSDFDGFVSEIAADVWNNLLNTPAFRQLNPRDFPQLYDILCRNLGPYRQAGKRQNF